MERRQETKPRLVPALLKETNMAGRGRGRGRGLLTAAKPSAPGGGNDTEAKVEISYTLIHLLYYTLIHLLYWLVISFRLCDGLFLFRHDCRVYLYVSNSSANNRSIHVMYVCLFVMLTCKIIVCFLLLLLFRQRRHVHNIII